MFQTSCSIYMEHLCSPEACNDLFSLDIKENSQYCPFFFFFNRFACFWPKGYQLGSLGKSHQNGDYLKQAMRKIVFPQESNLQPLDYRSTALPLELEKTPPRMLNFGYLNPATCLLYDCNDKSIKMFFGVSSPKELDGLPRLLETTWPSLHRLSGIASLKSSQRCYLVFGTPKS